MNQKEIAEKLNVSKQMVSAVLAGERRFGKANAIMAGDIFECDPAIFIFGTLKEIQEALHYEPEKNGGKHGRKKKGENRAA